MIHKIEKPFLTHFIIAGEVKHVDGNVWKFLPEKSVFPGFYQLKQFDLIEFI